MSNKLSYLGFDVIIYASTDGVPVIEIRTDAMPVTEDDEPACRVYLNDAILHEGVEYPTTRG